MHAVAIDQEAAGDRDLLRCSKGRLRALQLHVRDEMRQARARLFGPVDAGLDLLYAPNQRVLALVEPVDIAVGAGELALVLAELHVAPHRHPIADVVGEQIEPFPIAPLVEQLRFAIEEIRDLLAKQQPVDTRVALSHGAPPHLARYLIPDVILSAAKDLMPVASGDEVLRCAQDDRKAALCLGHQNDHGPRVHRSGSPPFGRDETGPSGHGLCRRTGSRVTVRRPRLKAASTGATVRSAVTGSGASSTTRSAG